MRGPSPPVRRWLNQRLPLRRLRPGERRRHPNSSRSSRPRLFAMKVQAHRHPSRTLRVRRRPGRSPPHCGRRAPPGDRQRLRSSSAASRRRRRGSRRKHRCTGRPADPLRRRRVSAALCRRAHARADRGAAPGGGARRARVPGSRLAVCAANGRASRSRCKVGRSASCTSRCSRRCACMRCCRRSRHLRSWH